MKLTESKLRSLVREELSNVLEMHGKPHKQHMSDDKHIPTVKDMTIGAGLAGMALSPYAIAQYLQTDPDKMKQVIDLLNKAGFAIQSLNPFEEEE